MRDTNTENYAEANGYDLADAVADQADDVDYEYETEAEQLGHWLWTLNQDLEYTKRTIAQGMWIWNEEQARQHLERVEADIIRVKDKIRAAVEREVSQ